MGTSTSNPGQKGSTPLVPSWLEDDQDETSSDETASSYEPQIVANKRFTFPRTEFTRYINSGGRDRSQGRRSISNYLKDSLGGSTNATKRLGAARNSSARLLSVVSSFSSDGIRGVEKYLSISNLAHKSVTDVFILISDFVCPDGGTQDEGIARDAYISAIEESPEIADLPFENLSKEQFMIFFRRCMANVIEARIINDIGNKIILLPSDRTASDNIVDQIKDFIQGSISDAIAKLNINLGNLSQNQSIKIVDEIYRKTFDIMISIGEE